jgi:hypothetical protein
MLHARVPRAVEWMVEWVAVSAVRNMPWIGEP